MERNLTMLTDLYQLTMMNGYLKYGMDKNKAVFDMFFRPLQNNSVYAVMAGLEQAIEYINNLHLRHPGGDAGIFFRASFESAGSHYGGAAYRNRAAQYYKSSDSYSDQGQQGCLCRGRQGSA